MFTCKCAECGVEFEAKTMFRRLCSVRCGMRRYRRGEKGKASVRRWNGRERERG